MLFGLFLLIIIALLWALFVEGWLFKIILFFFGWLGIAVGLPQFVPESRGDCGWFSSPVSWAVVIASFVCIMALLTTRVKD
jgi:hypothetical protein